MDAPDRDEGNAVATATTLLAGSREAEAGSWPYLTKAWLEATDTALQREAQPCHVLMQLRGDDEVWLPAYLISTAPAVDWDPRTYLGWTGACGDQVCCGVVESPQSSAIVEGWGQGALLPTIVVGSPLGYRSEWATTAEPSSVPVETVTTLVERLFEVASQLGARSVVAPWVPDRPENQPLLSAFTSHGSHVSFWGLEDYVALTAMSYDDHMRRLPRSQRYRTKQDLALIDKGDIRVRRLDASELARHARRIAELVCFNRDKNGAGQEIHHIQPILEALVAGGFDLWGYAGFRQERLVAICVAIRRCERLFVKWVGFDYEALGEKSGLYFPLSYQLPLRDAYAAGLRAMECGAGAHRAKSLRGAQARSLATVLWLADPGLRRSAAVMHSGFSARRRAVFDMSDLSVCPSASVATACGPATVGDKNSQGQAVLRPGQSSISLDVKQKYAAAARAAREGGSCCADDPQAFGASLYDLSRLGGVPDPALLSSLGCGNPTAVAELRPGETVLDLGSGGGLDVILSARRVGPQGRAYGVDALPEMLDLARSNAAAAGVDNAEFLQGFLDAVPLPDASVDVVISNCAINLAAAKELVFREMARLLKPGGRIGLSDVVSDDDLTPSDRADRGSFAGCIAGALSFREYREGLAAAGFSSIVVRATHDVADGMHGAIIQARR